MVQPPLSYPGVYVQEVPSGVRAITGVSTSIAMFVGMTARGVIKSPTRVLSFADYERTFGDDTAISEVTDQVRQFFQNGGRQAFVTRIAKDPAEAAVTLKDIKGTSYVLKVVAKDAGTHGNGIRVEIDYNTPSPEATFNLHVFREVLLATGEFQQEAREVHPHVCMDPNGTRSVAKIVNQDSKLVNVEVVADTTLGQGYSLSGLLVDWGTSAEVAMNAINDRLGTSLELRNKIQIRVDGGAPVPVTLDKLSGSPSPENWATTWQQNINHFLASRGTDSSVTVKPVAVGSSGVHALQITSVNTKGGSVFVLPAPREDAARNFQFGVEQGGIEVGGYANHRPAPTGYFARLGIDSDLDRLLAFAGEEQGNLNRCFITDTSGEAHSGRLEANAIVLNLTGPDANAYMYQGTKFEAVAPFVGSLRNVRENLELIAEAITGGTKRNSWTAAVHGHRLVLSANYGSSNSDINAVLYTDNATSGGWDTLAGYQIGEANCLYDRAPTSKNTANVRAYSLGGNGPGGYTSPGVPGVNGEKPEWPEYEEAFLAIDREVDLFNLLILPRNEGQEDEEREDIWGPASSFCQKRRAFLLMDPRRGWETYRDVDDNVSDLRIGLVKDHSAIYWPRLMVSSNGTTKDIDPSGSVAGLMARIDATRGVWKAPAGVEADLRSVRGVQYPMSDDENGVINKKAVNAIRVFPNGILSWGARTMDGFDNSGNTDYKYVPVRRFALFLEESLYRGLKWVVFEPNAEPLWAQIRLNVGAFMQSLFRQSAFKGKTPRDAYFVKCDGETTIQDDINKGIVNIWVGFAPLKPAEFVILYLQQMAGAPET